MQLFKLIISLSLGAALAELDEIIALETKIEAAKV
jgi:hypothetical protein